MVAKTATMVEHKGPKGRKGHKGRKGSKEHKAHKGHKRPKDPWAHMGPEPGRRVPGHRVSYLICWLYIVLTTIPGPGRQGPEE